MNVTARKYLYLKQQFVDMYAKHGFFGKTAARRMVRGIDVVRLGKTWEFMNIIGVLTQ